VLWEPTEGRDGGEADMTKLIVPFQNFATVTKKHIKEELKADIEGK
jgi:hypothetical protein